MTTAVAGQADVNFTDSWTLAGTSERSIQERDNARETDVLPGFLTRGHRRPSDI
jgi:hypothetical protein